MSAQRVAMRNIKECLRLRFEGGLSHEKIARALQLSKGVVSKYVTAASATGLYSALQASKHVKNLVIQAFTKLQSCQFSLYGLWIKGLCYCLLISRPRVRLLVPTPYKVAEKYL